MSSIWKKAWGSVAFAALATALAQDLTTDAQGKPIYDPGTGTTFSVAAPTATPTLVYNCAAMPLICENVASYAKKVQNPGGHGDLNGLPIFHFDPSNDDKRQRRQLSCGCFKHDNCPQQSSTGKQSVLITDIAKDWADQNGFDAISAQDTQIIMDGPNPSRTTATMSPNPRVSQNAIPGRFFRQGMAFTCDEFPAATFIQGGQNAETICAMSNWKIYRGKPGAKGGNAGKYPFSAGKDAEQDWQARAHNLLRVRSTHQ